MSPSPPLYTRDVVTGYPTWRSVQVELKLNRHVSRRDYFWARAPAVNSRCGIAGPARGFLLPAAIFILVVLGFFALTLARNTARTHSAFTQEGVSVQAFYAAESGAQLAMSRLFYNVADRAAVDAGCAAVNGTTHRFSAPGLGNCSSTLSCSFQVLAGVSYYTLRSVGSCGSGSLSAERTIAVSALME